MDLTGQTGSDHFALATPHDGDRNLTFSGPQQTRKAESSSSEVVKSQPPPYDPKTLLNPRSDTGNSRAQDDADQRNGSDEANNEDGARRMIENLHNITSRENVPVKKRKAEAVEEDGSGNERRSKAKFGHIDSNGGGIISAHMQEERMKMANTSEPIDLTNDDDAAVADEEVQVVRDAGKEEVCLGVVSSNANVFRLPHMSENAKRLVPKDHWPRMKVGIRREVGNNKIIGLHDKSDRKFGNLEPKFADALCPMLDAAAVNGIRIRVFLLNRAKKEDEYEDKRVSMSMKVDVCVYAPRAKIQRIGQYLSQRQFFLRPPPDNPGREVVNPQAPQNFGPARTSGEKTQTSSHLFGPPRTIEEMRREANNMFDSLAGNENFPPMEGNRSIIKSKLLSHQKTALGFLMQHERNVFDDPEELPFHSLWKFRAKDNGQPTWYHIITDHQMLEKPNEMQGGILADVMGLGKTLSILALIAETRDDSRNFRRKPLPASDQIKGNAQGTIIVCPKSVLSNWLEQIKEHTNDGKMKVYLYHGTSRLQDLKELSKFDVVLTTYNTAAAEFSVGTRKKRALFSINWYRIVLDEAHAIRTPTTQISKACCALSSKRRWAVTGTPVQNSLYDLGSLVKFLQLKPFDQPNIWTQYIMSPFKNNDVEVIQKLQVVVGSITLRRLKDTIALPQRDECRVSLKFSKSEWSLYVQFARISNTQLKYISSGENVLRGKAYAHILKSIGRLRSICAHGREMLTEEDLKEIKEIDPSSAIVMDIGDEPELRSDEDFISEKQAYEAYIAMRDSEADICESCNNKLGFKQVPSDSPIDLTAEETDDEGDSDEFEEDGGDQQDLLGHVTPCYHLICTDCTETHIEEVNSTMTNDRHYECPHCSQYMRFGLFPLRRSGVKMFTQSREDATRNKSAKWDESTYSGPHTKVKALLADLQKSAEETKQLPAGEPPIRSVVFSGWTSYLDLIEFALGKNSIGFCRIDGKMSVKERSKALKVFSEIPEVTVMLVSIKAGGQGLNLTSANKVYVMEPQFNPGVETQAVDRVHRIGQKRTVEIKHYIMEDSIEEWVVWIQKKKEALAQLSMEKKKSRDDEKKERMENLKQAHEFTKKTWKM